MKKYTDKDDIKLFENCKKNEDAIWYIEKGIEAENRAIKTYEEYVDQNWLNKEPELQITVRNNYYDEIALFLRDLGLKEEKDFTRYENILHLDAQIVINNIIETNKKLFSINKTKCKKLFMGTQIMETWDSLGIYIQEL